MELLVHCHSFLYLIILKKNGLSTMELFVKDSQFGLDSEVIDAFSCNQFVYLSEVISLGYISKGSIAPLCNIEVLLL